MKQKISIFLLAFVIAVTSLSIVKEKTSQVVAQDIVSESYVDNDAIYTSKTISEEIDDEGNEVYNVKMEMYTTQETISKTIPNDYVLVLDLSYSMRNLLDYYVKREAMKIYVVDFINELRDAAKGEDGIEGTSDDVDHRIAIVTFPKKADSKGAKLLYYTNGSWTLDTSGSVSWYSLEYDIDISDAFVDVENFGDIDPEQVLAKYETDPLPDDGLTNNVMAIPQCCFGDTPTGDGMAYALSIIESSYATYGDTRNSNLVLFTDGMPIDVSSIDYEQTQLAIDSAYQMKSLYNTDVYTIGFFSDANSNGEDETNLFFNYLSSNYPAMSNYYEPTTKESNQYYLAYTKVDSLFNSFSSIHSEEVTTIELDASTVIKEDISQYFEVIEGFSLVNDSFKVYTQDSIDGTTGSWSESISDIKNELTINVDELGFEITGYDFSERSVTTEGYYNEVTQSYEYGEKLVIEYQLKTIDGFIGGIQVDTTDVSGIYVDDQLLEEFSNDKVDIEVQYDYTINNQSIYVGNTLTYEQLLNVNSSQIDGINNAYVEITFEFYESNVLVNTISIAPNEIGTSFTKYLELLLEDIKYEVICTIVPCDRYGNMSQEDSDIYVDEQSGNIYVLYPILSGNELWLHYGTTITIDEYVTQSDEAIWEEASIDAPLLHEEIPVFECIYIDELGLVYTSNQLQSITCTTNKQFDISKLNVISSDGFNNTSTITLSNEYSASLNIHILTYNLEINKEVNEDDWEGYEQNIIFDLTYTNEVLQTNLMYITLLINAYEHVDDKYTQSQMITGLYAGESLLVHEQSNYSFRYSESYKSDAIVETIGDDVNIMYYYGDKNSIYEEKPEIITVSLIVENSRKTDDWLSKDSAVENIFANIKNENISEDDYEL